MEQSYFKRITTMPKKAELVFWWILRLTMIGGIVYSLVVKTDLGFYQPLQMCANLLGMFAFEVCQAFPKGTFPRYLPAYFQNISAVGFFLASFGGAFLNFYYVLPGFDKALHLFGCMEAVFVSYEIICAMQLRDKVVCPPKFAALCALGMGFIFASGWELFEFTFDQWFGGDAQHWDLAKAIEEVGGKENLFMLIPLDEERFEARFALMDTMGDAILNVAGAVPMYFILRFKPYKHSGKNNINKIIEDELAKNAKEFSVI